MVSDSDCAYAICRRAPPAALLVVATLLVIIPISLAFAEETLGTYDAWVAINLVEDETNNCILFSDSLSDEESMAVVMQPAGIGRAIFPFGYLGFLRIDHMPRDGLRLEIDRTVYPVFRDEEGVIFVEPAYDDDVIRAMVKGRDMALTVIDARGAERRHQFSLLGFTASYKATVANCGADPSPVIDTQRGEIAQGEPRLRESEVPPRSSQMFLEDVAAGARVIVRLRGEGNTDLDLLVADSEERVICTSDGFTDQELCVLTPASSGSIAISVQNLGDQPNRFALETLSQ